VEIFRISKKKHGEHLSGIGAKQHGGRWTNVGIEVIYCAGTRSLAMLELLAQNIDLSVLLRDYYCFVIKIPQNSKTEIVQDKDLFKGWDSPTHNIRLKNLGDDWFKRQNSLLYRVPSAVVGGEFNYIINPLHKEFNKIKVHIEIFPFDLRLAP